VVALVEQGCWVNGPLPFGYVKDQQAKHGRLIVQPQEAAQVRKVFALRLSGIGAAEIAQQMRATGLQRRGKDWDKTKVLSLLKNAIVYGEIIFNKEDSKRKTVRPESEWIRYPNACEPIVSKAEFDRVQELIQQAAPVQGHSSAKSMHVFSGMVICGQCSGLMQIYTGKGRSKRYAYYRCGEYIRHKRCSPQTYPAKIIDVDLLDHLLTHILRRNVIISLTKELSTVVKKQAGEVDSKKKLLERAMAECKRKINRLYEAIEEGTIANVDVTPRLREHRAREATLQKSLIELVEDARYQRRRRPGYVDRAGHRTTRTRQRQGHKSLVEDVCASSSNEPGSVRA
jgi:site-specific DNA recombinase